MRSRQLGDGFDFSTPLDITGPVDFASPAATQSFDFSTPSGPSTVSGPNGISFGLPQIFDFVTPLAATLSPAAPSVAPQSFTTGLTNFADQMAKTVINLYQNAAQIETAKAGVALAKAQGQQGVQNVKTGGSISPQMLAFGGLGLAAIFLLSGKK